jgi:hypothetical protein
MVQSNTQRAESDEPQGTATRRPADTAKVGNVEIAIWKNHGASGDFYTASSPTIRYKDDKGSGEWKDGNSYGVLDLLALSEAAREASAKIRELSKSKAQARWRDTRVTRRGRCPPQKRPPPPCFRIAPLNLKPTPKG